MAREYTDEFRNILVELYNLGKPLSYLSQEYGISKSTIISWIDRSKLSVANEYKAITKAEYQQTLEKMARLEEENEILKRATAIVARN
ncbi:MAG TPA: hypothetical protein DDX02_09575 [Clostridiaceae bacterium]|jgi:transposase|nr:hypothetical protein [Clostridiaceae bacterium]HBG38820.1 hypothetical protein [Clostridiaceae bacterium]